MKQEFIDYLSAIGLSDVLKDRISKVLNEVTILYGMTADDIFLCNLEGSDGTKDYTSLWVFNADSIVECKQVLRGENEDYDLVKTSGNIAYFTLKKENYDFSTEANTDSKMSVRCVLRNNVTKCDFMGSGINCKYLLEIAKKYIINNVAAV